MGNQLLSKPEEPNIQIEIRTPQYNQPVRMVGTERCFITSQNHGYAVDSNTLVRRLGNRFRQYERRLQRRHPP